MASDANRNKEADNGNNAVSRLTALISAIRLLILAFRLTVNQNHYSLVIPIKSLRTLKLG